MSQHMENNEMAPTPSFSQDTHWFQQGDREQGEKIQVPYPKFGRQSLTLAMASVALVLLFSCPTLVFVLPAFSGANGSSIVLTTLFIVVVVLFAIITINFLYYKRR